jgi:hypothetical protein
MRRASTRLRMLSPRIALVKRIVGVEASLSVMRSSPVSGSRWTRKSGVICSGTVVERPLPGLGLRWRTTSKASRRSSGVSSGYWRSSSSVRRRLSSGNASLTSRYAQRSASVVIGRLSNCASRHSSSERAATPGGSSSRCSRLRSRSACSSVSGRRSSTAGRGRLSTSAAAIGSRAYCQAGLSDGGGGSCCSRCALSSAMRALASLSSSCSSSRR